MNKENLIDNWHGRPIGDLTRGELIDALDWCVKELRKAEHERLRRATNPLRGIEDRDTRKCTGR